MKLNKNNNLLDRQRIRFIFHTLTKKYLDDMRIHCQSEDIDEIIGNKIIRSSERIGIAFNYPIKTSDCIIKMDSKGSEFRMWEHYYSTMDFYGLIDGVEYLLFSIKLKNITTDRTEEDCEILLNGEYKKCLFKNNIIPINNLLSEICTHIEEEKRETLEDF